MLHYEFLHRIMRFLPNMRVKHCYRIVFGVFGADHTPPSGT